MIRFAYFDASCLPDELPAELFSDYRREKLERLVTPQARRLSAGAELLLRELLFEHNLCNGAPLELEALKCGKPVLRSRSCCFSLSHSGDICACAISGGELGVDVEQILSARKPVIHRFFSEEERQRISASESPALLFTQLWTVKEAYIKYCGTTLPEAISKTLTIPGKFQIAGSEGTQMSTFCVNGYCFAVCAAESADMPQNYTAKIMARLQSRMENT